MERRSLTNRREKPRDLRDHRTAGAIVDRSSSDLVLGEREGFRRIDHGRTDLDACGRGGFGAREASVDENLLVGDDAILIFNACRVVALVADDRADVAALANADEKLLRGERSFRDPAETLEPEEPGSLDFADDESKLVHMREQHHAWPARVALCGGDQVAEAIGRGREAQTRHFRSEASAHAAFVPAEAGNEHKLQRERAKALTRRTGAGHGSLGYLPAPAVSPMTM